MTASPIGEIIQPILRRCERLMWLHRALRAFPSASDKKTYLMGAFSCGQIDGEELTLMIQAYGLEAA